MLRTRLILLALLLVFGQGCGHWPFRDFSERRARADAAIARHGVEGDPAVEAARAELEAELAREGGDAVVDGVELRVGAEIQGDASVPVLARLPLANPLVLRAERDAQRATSAAAFARLEGVALERRAALCLPSLDLQLHARRSLVFERYASRQRALLGWSSDLGRAGMQDEIATTEFQLASEVGLATRAPEPPPLMPGLRTELLGVLPELPLEAATLRAEREFVRAAVVASLPAIGVHRAQEARYRALAAGESASRYPSLKFVDFGFEPLTHRGQQSSFIGRVALEIPFGRKAGAEARHYSALAQRETSQGRVVAEDRVEQALTALAQLQSFHDRSRHWRELLVLADQAEAVADRWFVERLAPPNDIAGLLDEVFRTRQAALDAQERAGVADCSLLAATGTPAASWPKE